jgi:hypothetical protein
MNNPFRDEVKYMKALWKLLPYESEIDGRIRAFIENIATKRRDTYERLIRPDDTVSTQLRSGNIPKVSTSKRNRI